VVALNKEKAKLQQTGRRCSSSTFERHKPT